MARGPHLGSFEILVLLAVLRLGDQGYGVAVRREINQRLGRSVSIGAVYTALARLERRGYLESRMGEPSPERGGRARRFHEVRPAGHAALDRSFRAIRDMARGLGYGWGTP